MDFQVDILAIVKNRGYMRGSNFSAIIKQKNRTIPFFLLKYNIIYIHLTLNLPIVWKTN